MGPEHPGLWNATPGCRRSQDVGVCKHLCFCLLVCLLSCFILCHTFTTNNPYKKVYMLFDKFGDG